MVLLYIPPVQNLLRREVTAYASKATGMQIQVERIDLRFPLNLLVRGVEVIQQPDTLLSLESLNVRVQAWPLLKGKVEVDEVTLSQVAVNSANLIEGMQIKGVLGRFFLQSHGVDLSNETAVVNRTELSDTHIQLLMTDTTTTPKDTTASAPVNWKVNLHQLKLKNVSFGMKLPADSMKMAAYIGEATIDDAKADLKNQFYGLKQFLLSGASASYDTGEAQPSVLLQQAPLLVADPLSPAPVGIPIQIVGLHMKGIEQPQQHLLLGSADAGLIIAHRRSASSERDRPSSSRRFFS
jgi:hypothetical protein